MKAKRLLFAALTLALSIVACENNDTPVTPNEESETYTVSLDLTGEIEVSQDLLTRFTPDDRDLYGIQVKYAPVSGGSYKNYAYGLFDDLTGLQIELVENHKYEFTILLIDDAKDKIWEDIITINEVDYTGYGAPYDTYTYNGTSYNEVTPITNNFIYSEEKYFSNNFKGHYSSKNNKETESQIPDLNVYYGRVGDYIPQTDGEYISIFMKRMVWGLKITVADFFTDGVIIINDYDSHTDCRIPRIELTPENKEFSAVYSYGTNSYYYEFLQNWYKQDELDDAYATKRFVIKWEKDDGTYINWKDLTVQINRLKETVINLTYYTDGDVDAKLGVTFEDWEMRSGNEYNYGGEQDDYEW